MKKENIERANQIIKRLEKLEIEYNTLTHTESTAMNYGWTVRAKGYSQILPKDMWIGLRVYAEEWFIKNIAILEKELEELD